jgi:DNA topoisomerase-3
VEKVAIKASKTKPPQQHTDASILNLMENAGRDIEDEALREQMKSSGLGTPATRAAIIERLIQVGYAKRSGKHLVSTEKRANLSSLKPDEKQLYDLIARRLIAMHYPDYVCENAKVITQVDAHRFKSTGTTPIDEGWHAVYGPDKSDKEPTLPKLNVGDERKVEKVNIKASKTKPPQQHTDASILNLMENAGREIEDEALREQMKSSGLGTPATRAAVIERLIQMDYARRSGKHVVSTEKGRKLIDVVPAPFSSAVTTGKWEKFLSDMAGQKDEAERARKSERFMSGIRKFSVFLVDAAKNGPAVQFAREAPVKKPAKRTTARRTGTKKTAPRKKAGT